MNVNEAIYGRNSCRSFHMNQTIEAERVRSILKAGMQAPSGKNLQPWKFTVVDNVELIKELGSLCKFSRFVCNASSLIFVYLDKELSYDYKKDTLAIGACVQNMLLAAHEKKVASCWIGEISDQSDLVDEKLNIPQNRELMAVLAIGIENTAVTSRLKRSLRTSLDQKIDFWYEK